MYLELRIFFFLIFRRFFSKLVFLKIHKNCLKMYCIRFHTTQVVRRQIVEIDGSKLIIKSEKIYTHLHLLIYLNINQFNIFFYKF